VVTRLVSVLLPVFNSRATLAQALESIRRQRGVELECVAVDDGSSDGSLACLEHAAASDARIRGSYNAAAGAYNRRVFRMRRVSFEAPAR